MANHKYKMRTRAKLWNLSNCLSSDDEDIDNDLEDLVVVANNRKKIFHNPVRNKVKMRRSIVERNFKEFVSSTPMLPARKTFNRSVALSPIENVDSDQQPIATRTRSNSSSFTADSFRKKSPEQNKSPASKPPTSRNTTNTNKSIRILPADEKDDLDNSPLARPIQSTASIECSNRNNALPRNENASLNKPRSMILSTHTQTNFSISRPPSRFQDAMVQTVMDKGTQITDSLEPSIRSRCTISRNQKSIKITESDLDITEGNANVDNNDVNPEIMDYNENDVFVDNSDKERTLTNLNPSKGVNKSVVAGLANLNRSKSMNKSAIEGLDNDVDQFNKTAQNRTKPTDRMNSSEGVSKSVIKALDDDLEKNRMLRHTKRSADMSLTLCAETSHDNCSEKSWLSQLLQEHLADNASEGSDFTNKSLVIDKPEPYSKEAVVVLDIRSKSILEKGERSSGSASPTTPNQRIIDTENNGESNQPSTPPNGVIKKKNHKARNNKKGSSDMPLKRSRPEKVSQAHTHQNKSESASSKSPAVRILQNVTLHVENDVDGINSDEIADSKEQYTSKIATINTPVHKKKGKNENSRGPIYVELPSTDARNETSRGPTNDKCNNMSIKETSLNRSEQEKNKTSTKNISKVNKRRKKTNDIHNTSNKENNNQDSTDKKLRKKNDVIIPEIITESVDVSDNHEGVRRSKRVKKERVVHYSLGILMTTDRNLVALGKQNVGLSLATLSYQSDQSSLTKVNKRNTNVEKRKTNVEKRKTNVEKRKTKKTKESVLEVTKKTSIFKSPLKVKVNRKPRKKTSESEATAHAQSDASNAMVNTSAMAETDEVQNDEPNKDNNSSKEPILTTKNISRTESPVQQKKGNRNLKLHIGNITPEVTEHTRPDTSSLIATTTNTTQTEEPQSDQWNQLIHTCDNYIARNYFYFPQNNKVCRIDYCNPAPHFGSLDKSECLRNGVGPKSSQANFQSGYLEIQPGKSKSLDMSKKFSLIFTVVEGSGLFQVHDSYCTAERSAIVYVPLGAYYCIRNQRETERLLLSYVKVKPQSS